MLVRRQSACAPGALGAETTAYIAVPSRDLTTCSRVTATGPTCAQVCARYIIAGTGETAVVVTLYSGNSKEDEEQDRLAAGERHAAQGSRLIYLCPLPPSVARPLRRPPVTCRPPPSLASHVPPPLRRPPVTCRHPPPFRPRFKGASKAVYITRRSGRPCVVLSRLTIFSAERSSVLSSSSRLLFS